VEWRGHATALRQLQNKEDYALSDDIRALKQNLRACFFYVTVRALAVVGRELRARWRWNASQMR